MVNICFDVDFDGPTWPGPLADKGAVAGEAWVGTAGFLNLLEVQLGLGGPVEPEIVRAAALVPEIRRQEGFWSESARTDPMAVARTLLHWRDTLWMAGWRGQAVCPRLAQLAKVTNGAMAGVPDRLAAVAARLCGRHPDVGSISILEDRRLQSAIWRSILNSLEAAGTRIVQIAVPQTPASGDLGASRSAGFRPNGDGSLQLLQAQGPLAVAEELAAWLAAGDRRETVIIGSETVLDAALHRHGLPTLGAGSSEGTNALLEILPLVIALGWSPPDPQRALELLTLPVSPVPPAIAGRLVGALQTWPAVGSDAWKTALDKGLAGIAEETDRRRLQERFDVILQPRVVGTLYPAGELVQRSRVLEQWIRGRMEHDEDAEPWEAAPGQCLNFRRLVELTSLGEFTRPQLQRLIEDATASVSATVLFPAQAGLHHVSSPGAIAGPARQIVWWNFTRDSAAAVASLPFRSAERKALEQIGVVLPEPAVLAEALNRRWRRPLLCAEECLMLVCPREGGSGDEEHPHPLWDEIAANVHKDASIRTLVAQTPKFAKPPAMRKYSLLALPTPRIRWRLPARYTAQRREVESPTGAGALLGCPFNWVLQYLGDIQKTSSATLPDMETLVGSVAHELLARLLKGTLPKPADAEKEALHLFDTEGPRLAAVLFMPGNEPLKARSRLMTGRAAKVLVQHLRDAKLGVMYVEESRSVPALGATLAGRSDLVAGPPPAIIDLKSGGDWYRRKELENGAAYQLACYSQIHRSKGHVPPVAFFILKTQNMLTTCRGLFPNAKVVDGPEPQVTWEGFVQGYEARWKELAGRCVVAPGETEEAESVLDEDGVLRLTPPCRFCSYGWLCGHGMEAS